MRSMNAHESVCERPSLRGDYPPSGGLFAPDVVLPAQVFPFPRGRSAHGERRLLIAILADAIYCYQQWYLVRNSRGRRLFREAERWLCSGDRTQVFSFENICEILQIDAEYVRTGLRRWGERQLAAATMGRSNERPPVENQP